MLWFTGDTHFGHANIIRYCHRPFASADEMDEAIIANINALVQPQDILYHLGDFCFGRYDIIQRAREYKARIRCRNITLITGNHDPHYSDGEARHEFAGLFYACKNLMRIRVSDPDLGLDGHTVVLSHYAMRVWDKSHFGSWQLFGHSHGTLSEDPKLLQMDVGVDSNGFRPINLAQIKAKMDTKTFVPITARNSQDRIGVHDV